MPSSETIASTQTHIRASCNETMRSISLHEKLWALPNILSDAFITSSKRQPNDCLLNRLFKRRSKKTSKPVSLAFVRGIHRSTVNAPHKGPVTRKMFPFDDVIMLCFEVRYRMVLPIPHRITILPSSTSNSTLNNLISWLNQNFRGQAI